MTGWQLELDVDDRGEALFLRIARAITDDVRRGRLRPNDALPGTRTVAAQLGVHRNTVIAAYRELAAEGWVSTRPAGATFIAASLSELRPRALLRRDPSTPIDRERIGFPIGARSRSLDRDTKLPRDVTLLAGGTPDMSTLPRAAFARAYRRAMRRPARLLDYGDPRGDPALRAAIAEMLSSTRGLAVDAEDVLVTRGSQMALHLLATVLVRPGDVVAIERLSYRPASAAFVAAGADVLTVAVDAHGLDVDALEKRLEKQAIRAIYVTPHHHYPTTVTLAPARRLRLLELARRHRFAIVEDDYDHEYHYDGRPLAPLASVDVDGNVAYVGTLSKIVAPALRLGYVVAPRPLLQRMIDRRVLIDRQGDSVLEAAVAELLEEGELARHVRRMRRVYQARRDAAVDVIERRLGRAVEVTVPAGGMSLWLRAERAIDVDAWNERAIERGYAAMPGARFTLDDTPVSALRIGFAGFDEATFARAIEAFFKALPRKLRDR